MVLLLLFQGIVRRLLFPLSALLVLLAAGPGALAQVESFLLKPGSNVGPDTRITPTDCVTAADGTVTCNTRIENSPTDTPAKPQYQPFRN
ncbi:MAG: hypothetical protein ACKOXO_11335 [Cyanobium sp.]